MSFPFKLPLILDGAIGSFLMQNGLKSGECVEKWILENKDILINLQTKYKDAGSDIILTPTFGANREKLKAYGLENDVERINRELTNLTKSVAGKSVLVAGDISPSGLMTQPYGEAKFDDVYQIFFEQAQALKLSGVDLLYLETQMFLSDMRAGVLVAKELELPVFVTMTIEENGKTLMGDEPLAVLEVLQSMGADAVGINCSFGAEKLVCELEKLVPYAKVPLIAKPNAGKPTEGENPQYSDDVSDFTSQMKRAYRKGIYILGGCCGTTPEYIKAIKEVVLQKAEPDFKISNVQDEICVVNGRGMFLSGDEEYSEHIACDYDMIDDILDIEDDGNTVLLIDVLSTDDANILLETVHMIRRPFSVYANDANVLEYILKNYQGKMLINMDCSIDKLVVKMLCKKYGAIIF